MPEVHMTAAQARALGIDLSGAKVAKSRTTRKEADGPYATVCTSCGTAFTRQKDEDDHLATTTHRRFELVLERNP